MCPIIRPAEPRDLIRLEHIENKADVRFLEYLRPLTWRLAPSLDDRVINPGYVLVVADAVGTEAVGFAHVALATAEAHLEQLSVLPSHGRRGYGRALVEAAKREAFLRGFHAIGLRTFAHIPWNAPFYADCGFVETEPGTEFDAALVQAEIEAGTTRYGRRIYMACAL